MAATPNQRLPKIRLDQPRAPRRLAVPPEHQRGATADATAHVPAHPQRAGRCDADADKVAMSALKRRHLKGKGL